VLRWVDWTVREFHLNSIDPSRLRGVTGQRLCSFTNRDFLDLGCIKEHGLNLQHWFERIRALGRFEFFLLNAEERCSLSFYIYIYFFFFLLLFLVTSLLVTDYASVLSLSWYFFLSVISASCVYIDGAYF